jgi:hypothetical protein
MMRMRSISSLIGPKSIIVRWEEDQIIVMAHS